MSTMMTVGPANVIPGNIVSASGNVEAALFLVIDYLQSTYNLQAADTQLEESITNAEAQEVTQFQNGLNAHSTKPGQYDPNATNYIYQLEHLNPNDKNYDTEVSTLTTLYTNANAQNQAIVKVMDGNNSTAQNTLSQNAQGQQGLMQTMGSINSIANNLTRLIQG